MFKIIRKIFSDRSDDFTFRTFNNSLNITPNINSGLYIHIPFCKNKCPYCPYFKVTYDLDLANAYKSALIKEIKLYHELYGKLSFSSLYIGGGTPTLLIKEMEEIIREIFKYFTIQGDFAVELSPCSTNKESLDELKQTGFNLVSIGIQSFNDKYLNLIGRNYNRQEAVEKLSLVMKAGFETVNADMIFAYPEQNIDELKNDLSELISFQTDQITCYPLFTFPYTEIGRLKQISKLKMPDHKQRKNHYYFINDFLIDKGYHRTNVWSFSKKEKKEFSSVTRDFYLGLGPSSGSYNGNVFYFNTFSVDEYIKTGSTQLPISVAMNVSKKLKKNFWLYWQLYTTVIDKSKYYKLFGIDIRKDFGFVIGLFKLLNFVESENQDFIRLNKKGSHWIHLAQNYYALNYISKVWDVSKKNPWPTEIKL